jgi:pimeloyl-ACP methyl ester carboxylesterase
VHTYLHNTAAAYDTSARDGARAAVADAIAAHCPDVLLAHSLGSVVAYETLWAYPDLEVELLVTLGSPLGMPDVIFDRLHPAPSGGYGSRPPGVHKWVNIADRGDLVAIPRHLGRWFTGLRDREASIHWFDFHRVANYLACAATRDELASYRK